MNKDRFRFRAFITGECYTIHDDDKAIILCLDDIAVYPSWLIGISHDDLIDVVYEATPCQHERDTLIQYFEDNNFSSTEEWLVLDPDVVEQCTGLKDKNGNLIYEGDIIQHDVADGPHNWPVQFKEGCFTLPYQVGDVWLAKVIKNCPYESGIEVIGNIHENPDLLEEAK